MTTATATTFRVSDVRPAREPLDEIPYLDGVAGRIDSHSAFREMNRLDASIAWAEDDLERKRERLQAPLPPLPALPSRPEGSRSPRGPQEAGAGWAARRQVEVHQAEQNLADLCRCRPQLEECCRTGARAFEACSRYHGRLVAGVVGHPAIAALHSAFNDHRPVSLSPDTIWLLIAQGVANHVNAHAEALRPRFVRHAGQATLAVRRDDFIKGSPENPWAEVFPEFSRQIREHVGEAHDFFTPSFSTTGAAEKAAFEIVLMETMQSYFRYEAYTVCGIPAVTLEGTADDWRAVLERARLLPRFDLGWWLAALEPILLQCVAAAEGRPEPDFWQSIYRYQSFSGGNAVTGWVTAFFPYFKDPRTGQPTQPNRWLAQGGDELRALLDAGKGRQRSGWPDGPGIDQFPTGLARAPFLWKYGLPGAQREFAMEFLGGFVGVAQDAQTLCLRPEIGWGVCEAPHSA